MSSGNPTHQRVNTGVTAEVERRCLRWLARHMPPWVSSDHLTALGLIGMVLAGLGLWSTQWSRVGPAVAIFGLLVNWFGDSLDGTLARERNQLRPRYGFYVDHVVDIFGSFFLLSGLALSSIMTPVVAVAVLLVYLMVIAETFLATHTLGVFRMARFGIGPTELRILLAVGLVRAAWQPMVTFGGGHLLFDVAGVVATAGLAATLLLTAVRNTQRLYREEPLPR